MSKTRRTRPGNPQVAIGYLRASTDRQDLSPLAQREAIEGWAASQGVRVVAWHFDKAISGTSPMEERPQLAAALADLKLHRAGILLVARRDRVARDAVVAGVIEQAVRQLGAELVSADGIANGGDAADVLLRGILNHVSAYEVAMIRTRIRAALAVKKGRSERVGGIPYGYRLDEDGVHLAAEPAEQEVVELARELRANGMTFRDVADALEGLGHLSRTGRRFHPQQVCRMLASV